LELALECGIEAVATSHASGVGGTVVRGPTMGKRDSGAESGRRESAQQTTSP
jgi:hypothetical protein